MIRRTGLILFVLILACPALLVAADPGPEQPEPPRLKKKEKPRAEDEKPEPEKKLRPPRKEEKPKDETDPEPVEPGQDPKEVLSRISKNMSASEKRLGEKDPGETTRQIQDDVLKDLDALIQQARQQQQQQSQSSSSSSAQNQRNQKGSGGKRQPKDQSAGGKKPRQGSQPQSGSQPQQGTANQPGGGGSGVKGEKDKLADLFKDIWGHYPETLRKEMNTYSREKFMVKYGDLIKQYYSTLAEKSRRGQ